MIHSANKINRSWQRPKQVQLLGIVTQISMPYGIDTIRIYPDQTVE